ncbi:MAG: DNA topoisomerase III [Pedosphaera sp. Tous-C6FEB]|nr:MAG: DNA topoisomerase III [Pedosphaera sp. Tous-C6FEB]
MGKALIIAEKPSVAGDIAKALGGFTKDKSGEFFESETHIVSSAVGHLLELIVPEEHDIKKGKWTFKCLPHLPPQFGLQPIEKSADRLKVLQRLLKRKDVDAVINACDAGREGELIFRRITDYTKAKQPIQRLWLQSMTAGAIRDGFAQLRSDASMRPLADAAESRAEADWLIGINGTRAMTAFNNKTGGFNLTTVGRVQTPTLAILVEREAKIRKFVARDYWEVLGTFEAKAGQYEGRWFDEKFQKSSAKDADAEQKAERLWTKEQADALRAKCLGKPGIVTEESKPSTQISPGLYDLTTLQREANGRFGFSAKNTLGLAQALYEKHKVLTYPRTDARALPEDYIPTVKKTLDSLRDLAGYSGPAEKILTEGWVRPNKRIFNNAKISDHFAIIPTGVVPKGLSEPEQKLYDLVTRRFLAVFFPAAEFLETTRITRVEGEPFKSAGKVLVKAGWLEVYGKEAAGDDDTPSLVPVQQGESVKTTNVEVKGTQTKPPARYSEATLLGAMESAGKLIEDDELREAMSERGLGTPATRAAIIEGLIYEQYVHRNGRELVPSAKAFTLIALLNGLSIPELTKPELTGDWEFKLRQMQRGQLGREQFMAEIRALTERMVGQTKAYEHDTIPGDFGKLNVPCPKCGAEVHENYKKFQCQNAACAWNMWKTILGRSFELHEVETLLREKVVGPLQGFRSKQGFPFAAVMKLSPEGEAKFDFGNDQKDEENAAPVDFTGKEPLGQCPKCKQGRVFENGMNYVCERATGADRKCDFKTGAIILQQAIDRAQVTKLLAEGKTDLLKGFVSKKTNRKFEAFLKFDGAKVSFEFAPREKKFPGKGAKKGEATPAVKLDFTGQEPLGKCPKCKGNVFEGPETYLCERSQLDEKRCTFKTGKVVLQQPVDRDQVKKLLAKGKTDVLTQFISKAGKPFPAHLKLAERGKVEFEFPER